MSKPEAMPTRPSIEEFRLLRENAETEEALAIAEALLEDLNSQIGSGDTESLNLGLEMAEFLAEAHLSERAEELFLRISNLASDKEAEVQLRASTGLGVMYDNAGRLEEAHKFYQMALDAAARIEGASRKHVATLTNNQAIVCKELGLFEEAEALYHRAVQVYKEIHSGSHPDVATAMNNLGVYYLQRGDLKNAESMHIKALIMRQNECHPSDPDIAQSYSNLAAVYHMRGWLDKAEGCYQKALLSFNHCKNPPLEDRDAAIRNYVALLRMTENHTLADKLEARLSNRS